jgi:hypothetical protein
MFRKCISHDLYLNIFVTISLLNIKAALQPTSSADILMCAREETRLNIDIVRATKQARNT